MSVIIIEGVLFVALLATGAALVYFMLVRFTLVVGFRWSVAGSR